MVFPEHYAADILFFFQEKPQELGVYQSLEIQMEALFPEASIRVQKTQISFYGRHLFAAVSLPLRRRKAWPECCVLATFGLGYRLESPRVAVAAESYPGRWTHHVVLSREEEVDGELMSWIQEAYAFSQSKR